jgi:hypothetical protein
MWMLPGGTCFPSAASWDGVQNPGNAPDNCNILELNHNCPEQPGQDGSNNQVEAHTFPTYYVVRNCPDDTWRVAYDVYFTKVCFAKRKVSKRENLRFLTVLSFQDTGHRNDWEWAVVIWRRWNEGDSSKFVRWGVKLEQDGDHAWVEWDKIPNTINEFVHAPQRERVSQNAKERKTDMEISNIVTATTSASAEMTATTPSYTLASSTIPFTPTRTASSQTPVRPTRHPISAQMTTNIAPANGLLTALKFLVCNTLFIKNPSSLKSRLFYRSCLLTFLNYTESWNFGDADSTPASFWQGQKYDICSL